MAIGAAQAPRPAPPQIPQFGTGMGGITGTVIDEGTGRPVPGAIVSIAILAGNVMGPSRRQTTDARGRFAFTDLPASDGYLLSGRKLGYEPARPAGLGAGPAAPRTIALADGEWRAAVTVRLVRQPAVNGTITDEAGEPVAGATVMLLARIVVSGQPQLGIAQIMKTDDRGMYRFAPLQSGEYLLAVPSVQWTVPASADVMMLTGQTPERIAQTEIAGGTVNYRRDPSLVADASYRLLTGTFPTPPAPLNDGRLRVYPTWYYPAARQPAQAQTITLAPGEDRKGIDIQIQPVVGSRVRGRVDGPANARTSLTLRLVTDETELLGPGTEIATALVTPSGDFTFLGVPAGRYAIVAQPIVSTLRLQSGGEIVNSMPAGPAQVGPGMSGSALFSSPGGWVESYTTPNAGWHGRTAIDVGDADLSDVIVRLQRGVAMRGRLVFEGPPAASGRGPSVAGVRLSPTGGRLSLGQLSARPRPDAEQTFTMEGLMPGEYMLEAFGAGQLMVKSVVWDGRDYTYRPFDTTAGTDIDGVIVTMTSQACRIDGTVRDSSGAPPVAAVVMFFPVEREQWSKTGFLPARFRSVSVSTGGTYALPRLPAGEYFVIALPETDVSRWRELEFLARAAPLATRVAVQWGDTVTQALTLREVK